MCHLVWWRRLRLSHEDSTTHPIILGACREISSVNLWRAQDLHSAIFQLDGVSIMLSNPVYETVLRDALCILFWSYRGGAVVILLGLYIHDAVWRRRQRQVHTPFVDGYTDLELQAIPRLDPTYDGTSNQYREARTERSDPISDITASATMGNM